VQHLGHAEGLSQVVDAEGRDVSNLAILADDVDLEGAELNKWYVYTFIADRPFRSVKATIRALTPRTSQHDLRALLIRINQITRGWTNYFKHAVAKRTFSKLQHYTWWRIVRMMRTRHRWKWKDVRRWLTDHTGRWHPISADGIELFNPETIPITRYRYRGQQIPNPWAPAA